MNRHLALLHLAEHLPVPLQGRALHRAGLAALAAGQPQVADRLFDRAGLAYRRELDVERLARLRVHQMIARCRMGQAEAGEDPVLEVERRLARLPRIEALEPPFEVVDARDLLASWMPGVASDRDRNAA